MAKKPKGPEHRVSTMAGSVSFRLGEAQCTAGCVVKAEPGNPDALARAWLAHRGGQAGHHIGNDHRG